MCLTLMNMSGGRGATSYSGMVIGRVGEPQPGDGEGNSKHFDSFQFVLSCPGCAGLCRTDQAQTFLILWTC